MPPLARPGELVASVITTQVRPTDAGQATFDSHFRGATFDRSREFPNFFLSEAFRALPPQQIPEHEIERAIGALELAMGSVLGRLTVPITNAQGQLENV